MVYRRRRQDWLSDAAAALGAEPDSARVAARRAALEIGKAVLIARDGWTGDHVDDVCLLCEALAEELELDDTDQANLFAAAQLHDIGKIALPESILQKPGPLEAHEWQAVREHTPTGERIIGSVPELTEVGRIVRHSHEHWDGSGYPDGLAGDEIPLASRIVLCADAFHAVRSPRPYRPGRSARSALKEVQAHSGSQFDPHVVDALERVVRKLRAARSRRFSSSPRTALRSRRLAVLLLALTTAGSAFAALTGELSRGRDEAIAQTLPGVCQTERCSFRGHALTAALLGTPSPPRSRPAHARARAAKRRKPRTARPDNRRSRPTTQTATAAHAAPSRGAEGVANLPRASVPPGTAEGSRDAPDGPRKPPAGRRHPGRGHAYAYGHQKRLQNPHPPKPPPGRMKPKPRP